MINERVESRPSVPEVRLPDPRATFLVTNGVGKEEKITITLSEWKDSVRLVAEEWRSLKAPLAQIRERARALSKKTHGGRSRSSTEKRQLLPQSKDSDVIALGKRNKSRRELLAKEGTWLLLSSSGSPLTVKLNKEGKDEIVSGQPLDEGEADWRTFILREGALLLGHPNGDMVRQFFNLRRNEQLEIGEKLEKARKKLEDFQNLAVDLIPEELAPFCSRITSLDFTKPLLPELEILRRDN